MTTQQEAIDVADALVEGDGKVHVFGAPEDRSLAADERLCSDPEREGIAVIFHVATVSVGASEWACSGCGVTSAADSGARQ